MSGIKVMMQQDDSLPRHYKISILIARKQQMDGWVSRGGTNTISHGWCASCVDRPRDSAVGEEEEKEGFGSQKFRTHTVLANSNLHEETRKSMHLHGAYKTQIYSHLWLLIPWETPHNRVDAP